MSKLNEALVSHARSYGCAVCGYKRYYGALEFHHVDPGNKSFNVPVGAKRESPGSVQSEIEKCVVLCANCHREIHAGVTKLDEAILAKYLEL